MRAGASRSGFYTPRSIVLLGGVDVAKKVWKNTLTSTDILNEQPDTAKCTLFDTTGLLVPTVGQTMVLADGSNSNRYFGGTLVKVRRKSVKSSRGLAVPITLYDVDVTDWTWLLNRRTVTKQYAAGTLANVIVIDLITNFASGFTTLNVQAGAPALTAPLVLKGIKIGDALSYLCQAIVPNWNWYPDVNQDIHFFLDEFAQRPKSIVPGVTTYDQLDFTLDLTQIRTRIVAEGGGGATTTPHGAGSIAIAVDECAWYSATGGTVISSGQSTLITYTGITASSGPGSLSGVPSSGPGAVTVNLLQGDHLNVWVVTDDPAAQTALGLLEGGDGIHEHYLAIPNGTIARCQQDSKAELDAYSDTNITGTLWSRDKAMRSGKTLSIAMPARGINADVTIQQVKRTLMTVNTWQFEVTFATVWRNLVHILKRLRKVGRN